MDLFRSWSRVGLLGAALVLVVGCTVEEPPRDDHKALQRAIQEPIDKARAAEAQVQAIEAQRRAALEAAEGAGEPEPDSQD